MSGHATWTEALLPGARIGVRYQDDPNYVHERIFGWPVSDTAWLFLTPHDHEYVEALADWSICLPLTDRHRYGDHVGDEDKAIACVALLAGDALWEYVERARRLAPTAQRDEPGIYKRRALEARHYVGYCGSRRLAFAGGAVAPPFGCVAVLESEIRALRRERDELQRRLFDLLPAPREALRDRVQLISADDGGGPALRVLQGGLAPEPTEDPKEDDYGIGDDERTLCAEIDGHHQQHKPWHNAVRDSFARGCGCDWALAGSPSCLEVAKHFDKHGGDPRSWLQRFEADKGIERTDRMHHELATLTYALYYAGSVDCLNLGGLLCLEVIARRLESLVEALGDGQVQGHRDTGKYLAGRKSTMDCVAPQLWSWASLQVQDGARVQGCRTRARGSTTRSGGSADNDIGDDGPAAPDGGRLPPAAGKGKKPRGRGRGGGCGKM